MKLFKLFQFKRRAGFTMMEAMTTVALIAIVSSITLPAVDNFFSGIRVKSEAEIFVQNVRLARYKALDEQAVYRLIFMDGTRELYRIQTHIAFDEGSGVDYDTASIPPAGDNTDESDYFSLNWLDVDTEEYSLGPGAELASDLPQDIYFWPNGMIYNTGDIYNPLATAIGEHYVAYKYGGAGIRVLINSMGVFASEAFSATTIEDAELEPVW